MHPPRIRPDCLQVPRQLPALAAEHSEGACLMPPPSSWRKARDRERGLGSGSGRTSSFGRFPANLGHKMRAPKLFLIPGGSPGRKVVDFVALPGPLLPQNPLKRWGASPPAFSSGCCVRRGRLDPRKRRFSAAFLANLATRAVRHRVGFTGGSVLDRV